MLTPIQMARVQLAAFPYNPGGLMFHLCIQLLCCSVGSGWRRSLHVVGRPTLRLLLTPWPAPLPLHLFQT